MDAVDSNVAFAKLEETIISFWKDNDIFLRSMAPDAPRSRAEVVGESERSKRPSYVFYDGPPFATGLPHYGHLLAGTIKDVVGRFFTMKGYHVDRRFGWDCHGVPVEFEIQKKLDLHGAKAIREFGIDNFNEECRGIVQRYSKEWEAFVERSGRWVDFDRQYMTMDLDYMESIWWVLKRLWDRGLVYEGFKCVPYSPGINTPLSNFEANLNYKTVQDPAVTVRAKLRLKSSQLPGVTEELDLPVSAYVWTTTPWTLPSNMALAIGDELEYVAVRNEQQEVVVLAQGRLEEFFPELVEGSKKNKKKDSAEKRDVSLLSSFQGRELLGVEYDPFFSYFESERAQNAFRIYSGADFVTEEDGTGVVHMASFGEDDLKVFQANNITVVDPVDEDGMFEDSVSDFAGMYIKDADSHIIANLKERELLVSHKTLEHSYPFCWRTDKPLIYKSISSWFVNVEQIKEFLIHSNSEVNWVPSHLKEGRFGNWLEGARDWAISRNRFWGTPIPVWSCEKCETFECLGSIAELESRSGEKVTDLHSHCIDHLEIACEKCSTKMTRIPQVLDCWFESGAMPYAQAHYPFENKETFEENFPADFIAEGLDQTRGWFYTLLVLSSALFGKPAFKNVVVNGILLAEDGRKMSKSLKNYPPPDKVMNKHGADALRLYMLSSPATRAEELKFSEEGVKQVVRQTLLPLWNAYNFLVTYALVDKWSPSDIPEVESENLLDKWILSKVASLVEGVDASLTSYHLYTASQPILDYVEQLTNWYIRLNRRRFWGGQSEAEQQDKAHAYATLYKAIITFVRVLAPIAPFISEEIFQNLKKGSAHEVFDSVHLTPFPDADQLEELSIDRDLERTMELFEEVILLGRGIRNEKGVKLRQPLSSITIVYPEDTQLALLKSLDSYIQDELNVKSVKYSSDEERYVDLTAKLNTIKLGKVLGPKLGKDGMKELHTKIRALSTSDIRAIEEGTQTIEVKDVELGTGDIVIERTPKKGDDACASSGRISIQLEMSLTPELRMEGLSREFVNRIQRLRKESGFGVADRIVVSFMTACPKLSAAVETHREHIMSETLSIEIKEVSSEQELGLSGSSVNLPHALEVDGKTVILTLNRLQS